MAPDIEPRPHQKEAVAATAATLRNHTRASVIAACGTGKTLIAARTAARITPRGRVLVLLPTLDLLSQTIRSSTANKRSPVIFMATTLPSVGKKAPERPRRSDDLVPGARP